MLPAIVLSAIDEAVGPMRPQRRTAEPDARHAEPRNCVIERGGHAGEFRFACQEETAVAEPGEEAMEERFRVDFVAAAGGVVEDVEERMLVVGAEDLWLLAWVTSR
jgi:hypothetical protein